MTDWRYAWRKKDLRDAPPKGFYAIITSQFKIVQERSSVWELYDMTTDRCEKHDLADTMPEKVKQLADIWGKMSIQFDQEALVP